MSFVPAYAVDGGRVDAAALRRQAWSSTNGASGVTKPLDLKVSAYTVPGAGVNIRTGGGVVESTYATAGACESYEFANTATTQLAVPGGLPSQTTYYVIARIDDWHFNQTPEPADPLTYNYVRPDVVTSAALASVSDPYITLAKIVLPANTAAITNAMITDLRNVANPRTKDIVIPAPAVSSDVDQVLNSAAVTGEIFPAARIAMQTVDVPAWATRIQIMATAVCINYAAGTNPYGDYWVEWGDTVGSSVKENVSDKYHFDSPGGTNMTISWPMATDQYVPAKYRGTSTSMWFKARYSTSGMTGSVKATKSSGMIWHVRFLEIADNS